MIKKWNAFDYIIMIFLLFAMLISLAPLINAVALSFSGKTAANSGKVMFYPVDFTLAPYKELVKDSSFFRSFFNSFVRVVSGGGINVFLIVIMGYPLSKTPEEFRKRNVYMWFVVFTMLFNGGLVPNYMLVKSLGLINKIWALVLPPAVPVFSVLIYMNYLKSLPKELEEAALVDGAHPFQSLWFIILPLSKPCLATVTLFSIIFHWNSFFDGLIYMNRQENLPLQSFIRSLTVNPNLRTEEMTSEELKRQLELSNLTFNSAKIVVSIIPVLLIYPFLQKYFVGGIVLGAVKG